MANKYSKRFLIIVEIKIKTTVRYQYTFITMSEMKKTGTIKLSKADRSVPSVNTGETNKLTRLLQGMPLGQMIPLVLVYQMLL